MLLAILQIKDSYIDVDTIIVKMKKQFSFPLFSFYFKIFTLILSLCLNKMICIYCKIYKLI